MKNDMIMLGSLVKRSVKIFIKDKVGVFFSLLAPLIVLCLYVLFLSDVQMQTIEQAFEGIEIEKKLLKNFIDNWMLAGVVSVACVTVSFSAQQIMVKDKEVGVISDFLASPVKRYLISISYFIANAIVTMIICGIVLIIAFIYMAISGWTMTVGQVFMSFGLLIMSVFLASAITSLISKLIKTTAQHSAVVGIISAAIGFFMGAFMPISIFPTAIQYVTLFIPSTYSAGLFRELFMREALNNIVDAMPVVAQDKIKASLEEGFSLQLNFFGEQINANKIAIVFVVVTIIILAIWAVIEICQTLSARQLSAEKKIKTKDKN